MISFDFPIYIICVYVCLKKKCRLFFLNNVILSAIQIKNPKWNFFVIFFFLVGLAKSFQNMSYVLKNCWGGCLNPLSSVVANKKNVSFLNSLPLMMSIGRGLRHFLVLLENWPKSKADTDFLGYCIYNKSSNLLIIAFGRCLRGKNRKIEKKNREFFSIQICHHWISHSRALLFAWIFTH